MSNVNDFIGYTAAGIYPDCRNLLDFVQGEALKYLKEYREPIPLKKLASLVGFLPVSDNFFVFSSPNMSTSSRWASTDPTEPPCS